MKLSVPYRGNSKGFNMGVCGMGMDAPHQDQAERDIRYLANMYFSLIEEAAPSSPSERNTDLSARQLECLRWAAAGKSYADIADIVGLSERGVRFHLNSARDILGFATILQTVVYAAKTYDIDPFDGR